MIPAGYMAKRVSPKPEWIKADGIQDVLSVSGCISEYFADYISHWKHNGYWLFDSPAIIQQLAKDKQIDLAGTTLFFYEVYEQGFHEEAREWTTFDPETSFATNPSMPGEKQLCGFDVVTFCAGTSPECSPLSCNALAATINTNNHCLLNSLEEAKQLLESGRFNNSEQGPFRIFAVYLVDWGKAL